MQCPKCQYIRKATDDAPEWQCPSCKVAYNKVAQTKQPKQAQTENEVFLDNDTATDAVALNPLEWIVVIAIVLATVPWMVYCMNTLLPAMGVKRVLLKSLIILGIFPSVILIGLFIKLRPFHGGELSTIRRGAFLVVILLLWVTINSFTKTDADRSRETQEYWDSQNAKLIPKLCHGGQLDDDAMNEAVESGYKVNPRLRCIEKESYEKVQAQLKQYEAQHSKEMAIYEKQRLEVAAKNQEDQAIIAAQQADHVQSTGEILPSDHDENQPAKLPPGMFYRCTAPDRKSYSYINRTPCPAGDVQTIEESTKPNMPRSPSNTGLVRCTTKDGNVSFQKGNCASSDDIQQAL